MVSTHGLKRNKAKRLIISLPTSLIVITVLCKLDSHAKVQSFFFLTPLHIYEILCHPRIGLKRTNANKLFIIKTMQINFTVKSVIIFFYFMKKWADRISKDIESNVEAHGEAQNKILNGSNLN